MEPLFECTLIFASRLLWTSAQGQQHLQKHSFEDEFLAQNGNTSAIGWLSRSYVSPNDFSKVAKTPNQPAVPRVACQIVPHTSSPKVVGYLLLVLKVNVGLFRDTAQVICQHGSMFFLGGLLRLVSCDWTSIKCSRGSACNWKLFFAFL